MRRVRKALRRKSEKKRKKQGLKTDDQWVRTKSKIETKKGGHGRSAWNRRSCVSGKGRKEVKTSFQSKSGSEGGAAAPQEPFKQVTSEGQRRIKSAIIFAEGGTKTGEGGA